MSSARSQKRHRRSTAGSSTSKIHIYLNIYDLLPPSTFANLAWTLGLGVYHSAVEINGIEYAYGGHDQPGVTGVYYSPARKPPTGTVFRTNMLHGFTLLSDEEIEAAVEALKHDWLGDEYNLLTRNCNHFTSCLLQKLTSHPGPGWLNRAAAIGTAMPCLVPALHVPGADEELRPLQTAEDEWSSDDDLEQLPPSERAHMTGLL